MGHTRRRTASALAGCALLLSATPALASAAAEPVDLGGVPVQGSTDPTSPTELGPGLWADTIGVIDQPNQTHHYSYTRRMSNSTVHLGVIGTPDGAANDGVEIDVTSPEACGSDSATSYGVPQSVFGTSIDVGPDDADDVQSACLRSPTLTFTVSRNYSSAESALPVAIKVVEEAPVRGDSTSLPTAPTSPALGRIGGDADGGDEVAGSSTFDDAPELTSGTPYRDEVVEGGTRLYRVRLDWGQGVSVRATIDPQTPQAEAEVPYTSPSVQLVLVDPLRGTFDDELENGNASGSYLKGETSELTGGIPPVTYLSRYEDQAGSVPGDYWVAITADPVDEDRPPLDIGYQLVVETTGEASGQEHSPTVQGPGGTTGPEGYSPDKPFLVADGTFAADPSGNPTLGARDDADGGPSARTVSGIALAVLSLLSVGLGGRLLLGSRRPRSVGTRRA